MNFYRIDTKYIIKHLKIKAMKTITLITTIITIFTLCFSCIGIDGIDGRDGYDGRDGVDGRDANVGAAIYDVIPSDWNGNKDGYETFLNVPEVNDYIYENGAVLVYMLRNEGSDNKSFNQLPYTWLNNNISEYFDFDAYIGQIKITLRWVDNGVNNTEAPNGDYTFKVILIEGYSLSTLKSKTDIGDPDAVMNYLSGVSTF